MKKSTLSVDNVRFLFQKNPVYLRETHIPAVAEMQKLMILRHQPNKTEARK